MEKLEIFQKGGLKKIGFSRAKLNEIKTTTLPNPKMSNET